MKIIDIHSNKVISEDVSLYGSSINSNDLRSHIEEIIDFNISESQWKIIDSSFGEYWNNKIGIGGYFYWDEVSSYVYENTKCANELLSYESVDIIVNLMLSKIQDDGGFMD